MWKNNESYPLIVACMLAIIYMQPFYQKLIVFNLVTSQPLPAIVIISMSLFLYWYRRPNNFPPGPRGIPFLGVLPQLGKNPHLKMVEWGKKYGNILGVRIGRQDWVVLNDFESIKKGFVSRYYSFSNKPLLAQFNRITGLHHGLFNLNYNEKWKTQRKFGVTAFRSLGVGKVEMEEKIGKEIDFLNQEILSKGKKPFDLKKNVVQAVANSISQVVFGQRFNYNDPQFNKFLDAVAVGFASEKTATILRGLTMAPVLEFLPKFFFGIKKISKEMRTSVETISKIVDEHKVKSNKENPNSFITMFQMAKQIKNNNSFNDQQLSTMIREFYVAGNESTTTIIRWVVLYLIHYPQVQEKMYSEITTALGTQDKVMYSNKDNMPYTSAIIQEVYRLRLLGPLNIPHVISQDTTIDGYLIPKGTPVLSNLWAVQRNPKVWNNPDQFKPERHINKKGEFMKSDQVIPFSIGPRRCMGEQLARMTVFMLLTGMVQKYEFQSDPTTKELPEINESFRGIVDSPFPYRVIVKERL